MIKVGLIGEDIEGVFLDDYPLKVNRLVVIEADNIRKELEGKAISNYLEGQVKEEGFGISKLTAAMSQVLQVMRSYDEVVFSIALVPVYPPTESMQALTTALQWMHESVSPDFLLVSFSSPEGSFQNEHRNWISKLNENGAQVLAPVGAPPSFPSSLDHVVAVSDKGFLLAGFDNVKTDVVIEDESAVIYHKTAWRMEGLSTELACAIELKNRLIDRLSQLPVPDSSPVILPDLELLIAIQDDLGNEDFAQTPAKPGLIARGKSYLKSVLSRIITPTGKVPGYIKEIRKVSCNGDGEEVAPCPFREESLRQPGSYVCGACGCGDREAVVVGGIVPKFEKLDYPFVSCPASMPGFSNYVASTKEARPNERKVVIEGIYGEDKLEKAGTKQAALNAKLERRMGWLNKL